MERYEYSYVTSIVKKAKWDPEWAAAIDQKAREGWRLVQALNQGWYGEGNSFVMDTWSKRVTFIFERRVT